MILSGGIKKVLRTLWIAVILVSILLYIFYGDYLSAPVITQWITGNTNALLIVYCLICIVRGFTLMPSTPFIFAGVLLFPDSPVLLLFISLVCILISSIVIYYASGYLGFGDYFKKNYPDKIVKVCDKLDRPSGFYFVAGWSLFPFTPTDLLLYAAGSIKLPFHRVIIPLMLGEAIICAAYIFNGVHLMKYFS